MGSLRFSFLRPLQFSREIPILWCLLWTSAPSVISFQCRILECWWLRRSISLFSWMLAGWLSISKCCMCLFMSADEIFNVPDEQRHPAIYTVVLRVFSWMTKTMARSLSCQSIKILMHLDDWLLRAESARQCLEHQALIVQCSWQLIFLVILPKLQLTST